MHVLRPDREEEGEEEDGEEQKSRKKRGEEGVKTMER